MSTRPSTASLSGGVGQVPNSAQTQTALPPQGRSTSSPNTAPPLDRTSPPLPQHPQQRSKSRSASQLELPAAAKAPKTVTIPPVPGNSWYAKHFTEAPNQPVSTYHQQHKGRVMFGTKAIPTRPTELEVLPDSRPVTAQFFDLGKEMVYGMAYLHSTPLSTEHRWRGRVSHLLDVKAGRAELPESIRKVQELRKENAAAVAAAGRAKGTGGSGKGVDMKKGPQTSSSSSVAAAAAAAAAVRGEVDGNGDNGSGGDVGGGGATHANRTPSTNDGIISMSRAEPTIYEHPFFDMLLGIKVFVNDELVEDHYPGVRSLPQCSATIDTTDAVNRWTCVPVVLMGYLNHVTLDTIDLYRTLSLSFVEHLLRLKFPQLPSGSSTLAPPSAASAAGRKESSGRSPPPTAVAPGTRVMELRLRVEVVYGCRAEAFFCTDFIARGACTLFLAETAKPAVKGYEEKLRALIIAKRSSEQIIRAPSHDPKAGPLRTCPCCANVMVFRCTVCGANFCGSLMCSRRSLPGYPCGCSAHKAMLT